MTTIESIIIAIVEGLTEFLPISSTGHMIIAEKLLAIPSTEFTKVFTVAIQLGAILAVVVLYWKKFFDFKKGQFYLKLITGVIPALVFGWLFSKKIDLLLESALTVAISLLLGGIVLLFIEKLLKDPSIHSEKEVGFKQAGIIGLWQCIAMIPGVSRSAASIIGGMQQGLTRKMAAEFSFFLAVPTMLAVTVYSIVLKDWNYQGEEQKGYEMILSSNDNIMMFALGNVIAFVVAAFAIKLFIGLIQKYGFKIWGWYRIVVGIALLIYFTV